MIDTILFDLDNTIFDFTKAEGRNEMDSIWINAPAKINIGLDVIRRREDGYHEVKMIMQSIRLFDRLTLTKTKEPGIKLTTNLSYLPVSRVNDDDIFIKFQIRLMCMPVHDDIRFSQSCLFF